MSSWHVFTGYTLEERFWEDIPADNAYMRRLLFGVHQRHTLCLLTFFKRNTPADKWLPNPTKLKKDWFHVCDISRSYLVHLGSSSYCIFFHIGEGGYGAKYNATIF